MAESHLEKFLSTLPSKESEDARVSLKEYVLAQKMVLAAAIYVTEDPAAAMAFYKWFSSKGDEKPNIFTSGFKSAILSYKMTDSAEIIALVNQALENTLSKEENVTDEASNSGANG